MTTKGVSALSEVDQFEPRPMSERTKQILIGLTVIAMALAVVWGRMEDRKIRHHFADTTALARYCERNNYAALPLPEGASARGMITVGKAEARYLPVSQMAYPDRIPQSGTVGITWMEQVPMSDRFLLCSGMWRYKLGCVTDATQCVAKDPDVIIDLDSGKVEARKRAER